MAKSESFHIPFVRNSTYPVRHGNKVRTLVDGLAAFRSIAVAIERARHSVFLTVALLSDDFGFPDGKGSLFDVLDQASKRGLDLRVLFWRPNREVGVDERTVFSGAPEDLEMLVSRGSSFGIRWDRTRKPDSCHHQKTWVVDAGQENEVAFVGGMNLNPRCMVETGHWGELSSLHDVTLEVAGPAATDVHHNFVQRWNEASERFRPGGAWGERGRMDLEFPARVSALRGESAVQIQRTVRANEYPRGPAAPGGEAFDVSAGETSIFEQYKLAITNARRSIYIENQALEDAHVVALLHAALSRGVEVVAVVPVEAERDVREARKRPEFREFFDHLGALSRYANFTMAGLAAPGPRGARKNVYVHSKIMLVDEAFATVGSCNVRARSFHRHTELNASVRDPVVARELRVQLFGEHLGRDTRELDAVDALRLFHETAAANARCRELGAMEWQGIAFSFAPSAYGA